MKLLMLFFSHSSFTLHKCRIILTFNFRLITLKDTTKLIFIFFFFRLFNSFPCVFIFQRIIKAHGIYYFSCFVFFFLWSTVEMSLLCKFATIFQLNHNEEKKFSCFSNWKIYTFNFLFVKDSMDYHFRIVKQCKMMIKY